MYKNPSIGPKQIVLVFIGALVFYLAAYHGIEYWRQAKGPWAAAFSVDAEGRPVMTVDQPALGITNLVLRFPGEQVPTNFSPARVAFASPKTATPFGEVIYEDLMFLPGVVTFNLFGHEIELLPRVLIVNKAQIPWSSVQRIDMDPAAKPAVPPRPPSGKR